VKVLLPLDAYIFRYLQGIDEIVAGLEPKPGLSKGTSIQRASNLKPMNKVRFYPISHLFAYSSQFFTWNLDV
jgi:hypothetical protein